MEIYKFKYTMNQILPEKKSVKIGVAGSGNLEIEVQANSKKDTVFIIQTYVKGFKKTWKAVIGRFIEDYPFAGLTYILHDAGAAPAVVALRLRQALETYRSDYRIGQHYLEINARERIYSLVDKDSFNEFLLDEDCHSPNLPRLNIQTQTDDGIVIGTATIENIKIAIAAQHKDFIGGSVGEVHGAKLLGLIRYAIKNQLMGIVFLIDSGGVRLQEANVGEIEISEIIQAILDARTAGIKTVGVVCGDNGAYGGMSIISGSLDYLIVNQVARIGVSGADVIQAVKGIETFDASDRPLVWRVYGGRTRFIQKAVDAYVSNQVSEIKQAICIAFTRLDAAHLLNYETVANNHKQLLARLNDSQGCVEEGAWLKKTYPALQEDLFNITDVKFLQVIDAMER